MRLKNVGAGWPAIAVGQLINVLADAPHSRASPLPPLNTIAGKIFIRVIRSQLLP